MRGKVVDGSYGYYAAGLSYLVGYFGPGAIEDQFQASPQLEYSLVEIDRAECEVGMFQSLRTGGCSLCPAGTFGASVGQASSLCSEYVRRGYVCLAALHRHLTKYPPVNTRLKRGWALLQVVVNAKKDISVSNHVSKFENLFTLALLGFPFFALGPAGSTSPSSTMAVRAGFARRICRSCSCH